MQTASSAKRTCREFWSAWEYTATVGMPSSLQAQMMRSAISPRFATRIFLNITGLLARSDSEQLLPELDGIAVLDEDPDDLARLVGRYLVHQLHGFHHAEDRSLLDRVPDLDVRLCARGWSAI